MTRDENQRALKRSFKLYDETVVRIEKYAEKRAMSRSEVIRVAMDRYSQGRIKTRSRAKRRLEVWIADASLFTRFSRRVAKDQIHIADAIEAAFALMEEEG